MESQLLETKLGVEKSRLLDRAKGEEGPVLAGISPWLRETLSLMSRRSTKSAEDDLMNKEMQMLSKNDTGAEDDMTQQ